MMDDGFDSAMNDASGSSPTLGDVARLAGVSPATVSRYLNRPAGVRSDKRDRIKEAIDRLGYVPHGAARALASRRSRMIGAIFPSLDTTLFGGMLEAFQEELSKAGYTAVVASSAYDHEKEEAHIRTLLESGVDAMMLVGAARSPSIVGLLESKRLPFVQTWVSTAPNPHPCIGFDNEGAAAHLTDYLIMLGHRQFGVITGFTRHNDRAAARLAGVRAALDRKDLSLPDAAVIEMPFRMESGRDAFSLIMRRTNPPTAIICGAEPFAYGAIFEAKTMGLNVPDDVSITGFDDMWLASQLSPSLTTIRTPRTEMGVQAARHLLARLSNTPTPAPRPLETRLVVRDSTAPPRSPEVGTIEKLRDAPV